MHNNDIEANYSVYMHTTPSGKVYIGITGRPPEERWQKGAAYKNQNRHFSNAIEKYGWDNIKHEVLFSGISKAEACALEIKLIEQYKATDPNFGYNIAKGGESSTLGRHLSAETKKKIGNANRGRHQTERQKALSRERGKQRFKENPEYFAMLCEKSKLADHSWSEEHRKKFHDARVGHVVVSSEQRLKLSMLKKGKKRPKEECEKISEAQKKPVICLETGTVYNSAIEAAKELGVSPASIRAICNGKGNSIKNTHWKYVQDLKATDKTTCSNLISSIEGSRTSGKREIRCVDTNETYPSIQAAALATGANRKCISRCCEGIAITAGGYHWEYANKDKQHKRSSQQQKYNRPVICVESGVVYGSIAEAESVMHTTKIRCVVNKLEHHNTYHGRHWEYYDEYLEREGKMVNTECSGRDNVD